MTGEQWRPIPGYEHLYLISDRGNIWALPREISQHNRFGHYTRTLPARPRRTHKGYIALRGDNRKTRFLRVTELVREAFGDQDTA